MTGSTNSRCVTRKNASPKMTTGRPFIPMFARGFVVSRGIRAFFEHSQDAQRRFNLRHGLGRRERMQRARVAFVGAVLGSCVGVAGFAYIGFVLATRPLHSGLTADFVAAIVLWLAGLVVAQSGTILRRRWRRDYIGREAAVSWISRNRNARVRVDGVPYWAFVRDEVHRGDRVLLQAAEVDGIPVRADFVAVRAPPGGSDPHA